MDLSDSIVPRSDQMNAEDLLTGPRTFTIREVRRGSSAEQPVDVILDEFPASRPWKPSKTTRRVLVAAWGPQTDVYAGRRITLFRDPDVKFGGMDVGGIRISHLSHIPKALTIALTVTRGRRAAHRIEPLPDDAPTAPVVSETTLAELRALTARKGIPSDAVMSGVNRVIGGGATDIEVITEQDARRVIDVLMQRPDAVPADVVPVDRRLSTADPEFGTDGAR